MSVVCYDRDASPENLKYLLVPVQNKFNENQCLSDFGGSNFNFTCCFGVHDYLRCSETFGHRIGGNNGAEMTTIDILIEVSNRLGK